MLRRGVRRGGVDVDALAGIGGQLEGFVVELERPHEGVVQALAAGAVVADVVGGPAAAEVVAAGGELADEVGEVLVVGVPSGFGAQHGHAVVGDLVVVDEEVRGGRVEEGEAGAVGRLTRGVGGGLVVEGL